MTLPALRTAQGKYCLVELDEAPHLAHELGLDLTTESGEQLLDQINSSLVSTYSAESSGVVLDPVYTFKFLEKKNSKAGVLFRLEQLMEDVDPLSVPKLISNWGIEDIKNNYASAKIELLYHPHEEKALAKKQLLTELYDYCQHEKITLLLKLTIYTPAGDEYQQLNFQEAQLTAIQELRDTCDLLALQFPQDPLSCATITAELDVPWLSVAEGVDYESYKQMLRTALENGAKGFLAGDILWRDLVSLKHEDKSPDMEAIQNLIKTNSRDRLIEMVRITDETGENNQ